MKRWVGLAALFFAGGMTAQTPVLVPESYLATIRDDEARPLPRNLTAEEARIWRLPDLSAQVRVPPTGNVRTPAEYEPNEGILIRWGVFNATLTAMTTAITTGDPESLVYIVVSGASQQASATTTLQNAGANLDRVRFITAPTNSVWIRDYGPRFIDIDGVRAIVDHTYNRPRPQDDAIPGIIASLWSEPLYDIGLVHGGGNFHLFDDRPAYLTELIQNENPSLTTQQIRDRYRDYQGHNTTTLTAAFPASYDSTQHIDMWTLPVARRRIIVGRYDPSAGTPHTVSEQVAADLQSAGYTVFRTPGWRSGSTHYTYTNAVIVNRIVLACQFTGETARNEEALNVFRTAFYDRFVVPVNCNEVITSAGAIHCIVMHVPKKPAPMLLKDGFD